MANYLVDPTQLKKYLPARTELDYFEGKCYISLVGFMFMNMKVMGISIPFHSHFEEVNLRLYVRRKEQGEWKRGTVFIKEIVPKPVVAFFARAIYKEHYITMPMQHKWEELENGDISVEYMWKGKNGYWNNLKVKASGDLKNLTESSQEEYIAEHYWGYTKLPSSGTFEYQVAHPPWQICPVKSYSIEVNDPDVFGDTFAEVLFSTPDSVMLLNGSEISLHQKRRI